MNILSPLYRLCFCTVALCALLSQPVLAAKSWGVSNEEKALFTGTVTDISCHLVGDCPADCGAGSRQLGLATKDQGMILVSKNLTLYTGAVEELYHFCGQEVEVDGLFTENRNVRFFQVQKVRLAGKKWRKAKRFHKAWAKEYGGKPRKAKHWYRKDPRIKEIISRDGYLGLGLEKDKEFLEK